MTICIIHTGGTIAMRSGPEGLAPADGALEAGLAALAHAGIARGQTKMVHLTPAIDSANARFADWNRIAEVIFAGQSRYAGVWRRNNPKRSRDCGRAYGRIRARRADDCCLAMRKVVG